MAKSNIQKLNSLSDPCQTDWMKVAEELKKNEAWLKKSAEIAANVLHLLREKGMTKQTLADKMGVKPQFISRIVKGNTNLTIETITKLEDALGASLIDVCDNTEIIVAKTRESIICNDWKTITRHTSSTYLKRTDNSLYQNNSNYPMS